MNEAQIHLALNHAPLFLAIAGAFILIIGMIRKNESIRTLSLYFLTAAAILTIPVYLTGEGTEEAVEHLPGVADNAIDAHEDMARIALIIIGITGVIALAGFFLRKKENMSNLVYGILLAFSLASFGAMAATAHLGGKIRHTELTGTTGTATNGENGNEKEEEGESLEGKKAISPAPDKNPTDTAAVKATGTGTKKDKDDDD